MPGYTLVRRLDDSGGQATVHLGRSLRPPHHEAAIKIYHSALRSTRDRQRFQREVEAMARLANDPHIIDVYDVGVLDNGQAYLAMRLCSGGSLATLLAERGPMSPAAVTSLGETLAEALGRASWPDGQYLAGDDTVRRDGQVWEHGGKELDRARRGLSILDDLPTSRRRVFLAVDTPGELKQRDLRDELTILHTRALAETMGQFLSHEPYEIDLELLRALLPVTTP